MKRNSCSAAVSFPGVFAGTDIVADKTEHLANLQTIAKKGLTRV